MRELLSQKVLQLKPSGIRKFFDVANEIPGVISLGVGEPDFATPYHIREAGIRAMQSGLSLDAALDKNHITILSKFYSSFSLCIC